MSREKWWNGEERKKARAYRGEQRLSTKRAGEAVGRRLNPVNVILQTMHDDGYLIFTVCSVSIVDCRLPIADSVFSIDYSRYSLFYPSLHYALSPVLLATLSHVPMCSSEPGRDYCGRTPDGRLPRWLFLGHSHRHCYCSVRLLRATYDCDLPCSFLAECYAVLC